MGSLGRLQWDKILSECILLARIKQCKKQMPRVHGNLVKPHSHPRTSSQGMAKPSSRPSTNIVSVKSRYVYKQLTSVYKSWPQHLPSPRRLQPKIAHP